VINRIAHLYSSVDLLLAGTEPELPGEAVPSPTFAPAALCIRKETFAAIVRANAEAIKGYRAKLDVTSEEYANAEVLLAARQRLLGWIAAFPGERLWVEMRPSPQYGTPAGGEADEEAEAR